jgi:hypothetical protein
MTNYAKDPELNLLANKVKDLEWVNPLYEGEQEQAREVVTTPGAERHLVVPLPNHTSWAVRMYLGGEQRTLGLVNSKNIETGLRFADMAQEYFWKYRVRAAHAPEDHNLNFSRSRVEQDMLHETPALLVLEQIEQYLLRAGAIKSSQERRAEKAKKKMARVHAAMTARLNHEEVIERLGGMYDRTEARFDAAEFENKTLRQEVQKLGDIVRVQTELLQALGSRMLPAPPMFVPMPWTGDPVPMPWTGDPVPTAPIITCNSESKSCITKS